MTNTKSAIQWTDATWNPVTGCSRVSDGCRYCYAETISHRFKQTTSTWSHVNAAVNVVLHPERLMTPLHWRAPRRVFVNSMSDVWHERVPDDFITQMFAVMALAPQHTYQILTKRPERMRGWMASVDQTAIKVAGMEALGGLPWRQRDKLQAKLARIWQWPLPNVWLGVSVEDQRAADERIPLLLQTPAAVRFISAEPLLGPVDLRSVQWDDEVEIDALAGTHGVLRPHGGKSARLDWVIVGGESGPHARAMDLDWAQSLVEQCRGAGVAPFVKQFGQVWAREHGCHERHAGDPDEWPEELRVREFPQTVEVAVAR